MASGPITFWQIDGENVEMVADLFSWTPKSLWMVTRVIKLRQLLLGRKAMANSILKSLDITLLTKVHLFKAIVFLVVMYGCESWALQEPRHWKMDAFKLWCWRRLLRVLWTARRSNQSTLMAINPVYSLEGLMLKLKRWYFGHPMWRTDLLEKTLMLGNIDARRRRGRQRMRRLVGITDLMDVSLNKAPGAGDVQGSLVCCIPWVWKESDMT